MEELFILGDLFEFFFEYRHAVPKGCVRTLGALAEVADAGISIHYFVGNHDLWVRQYLTDEVGMHVYTQPLFMERFGHRFFIAHGDGLSPYDTKYRLLKRLFTNPVAQWAFRWLHPDLGIPLAQWFSQRSRHAQQYSPHFDFDPQSDGLVIFARKWAQQHPDLRFIIMGHRHLAMRVKLSTQCQYINIGEWMRAFTFGRMNAQGMQVGQWLPETRQVRWLQPGEVMGGR